MKTCGIYCFINKLNNKKYVGQSINIEGRYKTHIRLANKGVNTYFYNALRKDGIENFDFHILIECQKEELDYWETFYIKSFKSNEHDYGYNCDEGGNIKVGHKPWNTGKNKSQEPKLKRKPVTEETRENMRQAALNRPPVSDETRKKISIRVSGEGNPMYGKESAMKDKHHSEESIQKIREGNLGKHHSEETKAKMRHPKSNTSNMYKHTGEHWYHLGEDNVLIKPDKIPYYESLGYVKGRYIPKRKIS